MPTPFSPLPDRLMPIRQTLMGQSSPERAAHLQRFFKTGPGEYAEGDLFLGLTVPFLRQTAKTFATTPLDDLFILLRSSCHDERLLSLLLLVDRYRKGSAEEKKSLFMGYLDHRPFVNNWDLVDLSAPGIVGKHLLNRSRDVLYHLIAEPLLWARRIAIVSTVTFIREGDFRDTLSLSEKLLHDPEPLLHKAMGWMLREVGKKDDALLKQFLDSHGAEMPRTALRYAIERFPNPVRRHYLESTRPDPRHRDHKTILVK